VCVWHKWKVDRSGMEDDSSLRVNVTAQNMPGYTGRDGESVHVSSGIRSTDFGQDVRSSEAKVSSSSLLSSKDVLEFHKHKHEPGVKKKENTERENIRAVDILRRNFGSIRDAEDPKDLEKVGFGIKLNDLDHESYDERMQCSTKSLQQDMESNSRLRSPDGNPHIDYNIDFKSDEDTSQSKEHVYCTVYCIANDNYRIPVEKTTSDHETTSSSSSSSDVLVLPPDLPNSELDHDPYPEPYTVSGLMETGINHSYKNADSSLSVVLTCRICLDDKQIMPLHCCKKAVCEECLKRYIISQVSTSTPFHCKFILSFQH